METLPRVTREGRIPSTWRDAIGKPLTTARITHYQRLGFYGEEVKKAVLAADAVKKRDAKAKCVCGQKAVGPFRTYAYLSRHGYFCPLCLEVERANRDKEAEQSRQWIERIKLEYA